MFHLLPGILPSKVLPSWFIWLFLLLLLLLLFSNIFMKHIQWCVISNQNVQQSWKLSVKTQISAAVKLTASRLLETQHFVPYDSPLAVTGRKSLWLKQIIFSCQNHSATCGKNQQYGYTQNTFCGRERVKYRSRIIDSPFTRRWGGGGRQIVVCGGGRLLTTAPPILIYPPCVPLVLIFRLSVHCS